MVPLQPLNDDVTWVTLEPIQAGVITVPAGFETDFASVPRIFTNIFPRYGAWGRAAAIHDWLYWSEEYPRELADRAFYDLMLEDNVPRWQAAILYTAVHYFGKSAWKSNAKLGASGYSRVRAIPLKSLDGPAWVRN